jgi:hypothetical protein
MEPAQENRLKSLLFKPAVMVGFFLTLGLGVVVLAVQQQQDLRSRAAVEPGGGGSSLRQCGSVSGEVCASDCPGGIESGAVCNSGYLKCCKPSSGSTTAPGVGTSCKSGTGKCIDVNKTSCSGTVYTGYCPGPSNVKCCVSGGGGSSGGCSGDSCHIGKSCSTPKGSGKCQYRNSYSCSGSWVTGYCPGSTNVVCCVASTPVAAPAPASTNTPTPTKTPTPTPTPTKTPTPTLTPAPGVTIFNLDLIFHGIGKGGDNRNPNGGGNSDPKHLSRSVIVDVYDFDNNPVVTGKEGQVTFDSVSGTYKGTVVMGTTLTTQAYTIKVKLSHSLRAAISRNIIAGTTNVIPVIRLVNGDANNDGKLDIEDYNIIQGCYSDFDLPAADCNPTKKTQADIDDDGKVNQFDMNLFLREMSVQAL